MRKFLHKVKRLLNLMALVSLYALGIPLIADQNTFFDSKVSVFKLNDGSTLQDLSTYCKETSGLPGEIKMNDVTTFGSIGERPGPSIYIGHFSVKFVFNMITTTGLHTIIGGMWTNKALRAFEYYPAGITTGNTKISGSCYLAKPPITSRVGDYVVMDCEFWVDNGATWGTA